LGSDQFISVVQRFPDWAKHRLVQDEHQRQKLRRDDRQRQVEVEQLTRFGVRRHGHDQVGQDNRGDNLRGFKFLLERSLRLLLFEEGV
tara:strand:- start:694 stop:957 length:264 start_codon:yes stop_codon:yes gene_type:complete